MSGKNNGVAIWALIIALIAAGFGIYSEFLKPTTGIKQVWTFEQEADYLCTNSYQKIPDFELTITVNANETVVVTFNALVTGSPGGILSGEVRITMNDVLVEKSMRGFNFDTTGGVATFNSITSQFILEGLNPGEYEFEVFATGTVAPPTTFEDGSLVIYTIM
ncbi:MAG: hypothetical protein GY870_03230 [archaeon]|nr:hypothetical protein [archaeon]